MSELELFAAALAFEDAGARSKYLDQACGHDTALLQRIDVLLRNHQDAGSFLEAPAATPLVDMTAPLPDATQDFATRNEDGSHNAPSEANMTAADHSGDDAVDALDLLQPSTKPGSRGRLGHYEVLEVLGQGGFGVVVRAFDETLQRVVAIKMMSPQLAATSPARKRFLREARTAAKVRHENVVQIYAVEEKPIPHLVMEYIPGRTLQQKLDATGPLETPEMLRLAVQIARGLEAAHAKGLIHRDIKPGNILLEEALEPKVKITDFGLARAADDASLTQSGTVAGTPMYMAPEQAEGKTIDQRADLFSLGSVLYVMLSGRPPFRASGTMAVLKRVCEDTPRPIREIIPEAPEWLCDIIAKLHEKKPEDRYQSAKEVAELLAARLADVQAGRAIERAQRAQRASHVSGGSEPQPSGSELQPPGSEQQTAGCEAQPPPAHAGGSRRRWKIAAAVGGIALLVAGVFATPFLYRYVNQSTVMHVGAMDPNLDKILVKQNGETVGELTRLDGMVRLLSGDYQVEVVCKPGYELSKYRVGGANSGATDWQIAKGPTFSLRLARADHVGINVELTKLPVDPSKGPPEEPGWVQLFNGKDLTGWKFLHQKNVAWKWTDRVLIANGENGQIITDRNDYENFHLRASVKLKKGHVVFGLRTPPAGNEGGYVCQIANAPKGLYGGGLHAFRAGATVPLAQDIAIEPADQWHTLEIIARGNHWKTLVDNKLIADVTDPARRFTRGSIGLAWASPPDQDIQFKDVEIKELPPEPTEWVQLFNGKDLDGWDKSENWKVIDRVLTGSLKEGLHYVASLHGPFANFHLRADVRLQGSGVGALAFRSMCYDLQLSTKHAGSLGMHGEPWKWLAIKEHDLIPQDGWFQVDLIADGSQLMSKVNGQVVAKVTENTSPRGIFYLGLNATNGPVIVQFKKIEIKELPPETPPPAVAPFDAGKAKEHQDAWAKHLGVEPEFKNSIGMKFRVIPPGTFLMGSKDDEPGRTDNEGPQQEVTITRPFIAGVHHVTVAQFKQFVKEKGYKTEAEKDGTHMPGPGGKLVLDPQINWLNPPFGQADDHPVICVSWNDARAFCAWLSEKESRTYTLLTEAQWEYACRAGSQTKYYFGDDERELDQHAWFQLNSGRKSNAVGQKKPNAWGLHDMHGNGWQWLADWRGDDYYAKSPKIDPPGPDTGFMRCLRGGDWDNNAITCRDAQRTWQGPAIRTPYIGFRVAIVSELKPPFPEPAQKETTAKKLELPPAKKLTPEQDDEVKTLVSRGNVAGRQNMLTEAVRLATQALAIDPRSVPALALRSTAYDALGRYDKVIEDAIIGLMLDAENVQLYVNRTNAYVNTAQYEKAIGDATRMLELNPKDKNAPRVQGNRGVAFAALGDYKKALLDLDIAAKDLPVALLFWHRSHVHTRLGNQSEADADRKRAIQLDASYANRPPPDWWKIGEQK